MFGLVLYTIVPAPEGDTDQSVFSIGYWYSYGHLLFCKWRCSRQNRIVPLNDGACKDISDDTITAQ